MNSLATKLLLYLRNKWSRSSTDTRLNEVVGQGIEVF